MIEILYGKEYLTADLDWVRVLGTIDVASVPPLADPAGVLRDGLLRPIGMSCPLLDGFLPEERVAVVVSDSFRKTEVHLLLPTVIEELNSRGIADSQIFYLYSTGSHRGPTEEEQAQILGPDMFTRFRDRTFSHDPADTQNLIRLGVTSRGTPVLLNRRLLEANRVLLTGTVVLHYFGGFGGGRKSVAPGLAGSETIAHNHALNLDPHADRLNPDVRIGVLDGNPVAEDMLEAARFARVDGVINTVLNRDGRIAGVFTGDMDAAHRAAAGFAHSLYCTPIPERADLVIASAGAAKNFIQSHKALFNAYQAVKPGGRIIFLTPSPEGYGGNKFQQWVGLGSRQAIIAELRKNAEINGQTALSTIEKSPITTFVTEMTETQVHLLGGRRADSLSAALEIIRTELCARSEAPPTCWIMPSASFTVPVL